MPYHLATYSAGFTQPSAYLCHTKHQQPLCHIKVIGSGSEKSPHRGIMEPPKISNSSDLASGKRDVANCVDFIIAGSEKWEDKMFKSLHATLACHL